MSLSNQGEDMNCKITTQEFKTALNNVLTDEHTEAKNPTFLQRYHREIIVCGLTIAGVFLLLKAKEKLTSFSNMISNSMLFLQ